MEHLDSKKVKHSKLFEEFDRFGKFQTIQYILICLPTVFVSMMNVNYVFVANDVKYRCIVPECESDSSMARPSWWPTDVDDKCTRPVLNLNEFSNNTCSNTSFYYNKVRECQQWVYEDHNSIVAEMNLACQSLKPTLVGSVHNAGMIVSMPIMGWISDRIGRKPAIIITSIGGFTGILKSFLSHYYTFLAIEFLESVMSSGIYTVAIVLMIEAGGRTKRVLAGVIFSYAIYIGELIFAILALLAPYWRNLILIVYGPTLIFISYAFLLKESVRWQLVRCKFLEVKSTLVSIINMNGINVDTKDIIDFNDKELKEIFNVEFKKDKVAVKDILVSKEIMTRLGVGTFCFFAAGFVYYGLLVHSVLLPGNKYTNFVLASLTSFPGDLLALYTFNKFGRRISLMCGFISCGIFCVATAYSPDDITWLKIMLFLCGKLSVALCFTGMFTYTMELFPTSARGSLVGFCNTGARIGSMLAPLTTLLSTTPGLSSILFAVSSVLAGVLLIFTPETKNLPLVDTIEQMEKLQRCSVTSL